MIILLADKLCFVEISGKGSCYFSRHRGIIICTSAVFVQYFNDIFCSQRIKLAENIRTFKASIFSRRIGD